ncbi:MAG: TIGR04376 family protein [Symploca sp. SIO3C6]|uniref:TIGR04376 family protein n=1 Tax=Symploca sp. SIO1C4 TaxID=2607765 RepID=A0A6B3N9U0_9CYAN|nr:TIGR04376 family protein [Symploca sp. SIO3C6]NER27645.1 TIGR04376 family protein [Symploca sp. SIO1C4]NET05468.1 TIGR04376 family protein [Symploca sp. SIO2B6]NET47503.1 TIGR04376 family protein [Merismopedia sp. SIO2A8]
MGLFDDLNRFLENRLEEFLRNNPHLELQALEEQLREQEKDTLRLIADLQVQSKRLQDEILAIAQDIQRWHQRVEKAKANNREDLARGAQEREAALLRQGNQRWGQMEGVKQQITQAKQLLNQIQQRRQEVQAKAAQAKAAKASYQAQQRWETSGWNQSSNYTSYSHSDPLEEKFQRWETEDELEQMKRNVKG